MRITVKGEIFNESFKPLVTDNEHSTILLVGGGGSGKSYFSFQRAVIRALQDVRKYVVIRKSATDLRRSCWEDLERTLKQFKIYQMCKVNQTNMTIDLPNGSQFLLMGLDNFEKVKSIPGITDCIIEEASEVTFDDFSQLKMRLRGNGQLRNQMVLMTNPISKVNWVYKHFFEEGCKEDNCIIHQSTYHDNRFINQTTIDALESYKRTNPYFYRVYCLGEFGSLSKQIFGNYRKQDLDLDRLRKEGLEHLVGMDFGFVNDATTIIESLLDEKNKKIYVVREFYQTGLLNDEIANQLKLMGLSKATIIADSAEQKSIEEIRRKGISRIRPSVKGQGSIIQGIQELQQYELVVDPSCTYLLEELENYSWKKDKATGEYINEPIDEFNHCIDALRYSLQCTSKRHQLRTLPKGTL
jgi:phage terminase large subunit